ncbi:hypothetical protein NPIL_319651 [Nephila pilipes]|uniref:Uncharacterized protein n=1 Tax=Nephila pilipes TaxID=299642 RepID=A0A8X6TZV1_NEPPI|nr:hypothetical protein NPIL_319651 [Nephila pilipes]
MDLYCYEPKRAAINCMERLQDEAKPTKLFEENTSKQMIACFSINTVVTAVALEQRRRSILNGTTICLPEVIGEFRKTEQANHSSS